MASDHGLRTFYIDSLEALAALMAGRSAGDAKRLALPPPAGGTRPIGYRRRPIDVPSTTTTSSPLQATSATTPSNRHGRRRAGPRRRRRLLDEPAVSAAGRPGWASLTPTELEVVRLVVDGLNNPEIAAKLFMSRGTVKTHLSHVFTKLDVANRTELATLATTRLMP